MPFGMPLSLSVANLLAGTGLGLFGFSPFIPAVAFAAARLIPIRSDLISGISLVAAAVVQPIVFS